MSEQDGEEVIISPSGRAVVGGQEINIEEDERTSLCPAWLSQSSPILKCGLTSAGLLFVAFISMVIVGLAGQSNQSRGGDESYLDSQYEQAVDAPKESTSQPSARPTAGVAVIPIESEQITISFSDAVELLLTIGGGMSADSPSWASIQKMIETAIAVTLFEGLPPDYTLGAIEIESVDGNTLEDDEMYFADTNHTIIYSTSVIVDCIVSDCNTAPGLVQNVIDESQEDVVQADGQFETTTVSTSIDAVDEVDMVDVSPAETTPQPIDNTDQVDTVDTIDAAVETLAPTSIPTKAPVTGPPTESPTYLPTLGGIQPLDDADCSESSPCGACWGSCSSDNDCAGDLLCFKRTYFEMITGCEGPGRQGQSYCYNAFADGLTKDDLLTTKDMKCGDNNYDCGKCEGKKFFSVVSFCIYMYQR
jgi:hypothetical protein